MTSAFSFTESQTFTITHARHLASKMAADLKRIQRFYGSPSDQEITEYEEELVQLLKGGYLKSVTYGFKREGSWIEPSLSYTAQDLMGMNAVDDDPGRIRPNRNVAGAHFTSFLSYSAAWRELTSDEKDAFKSGLPFQRTNGVAPPVDGYLEQDRSYSAGGRALNRSSVRNF